MRRVRFWSEGTRLAGDLYHPPGAGEGERYPAIVICHGWGQSKDWGDPTKPFQRHAEAFAEAGYVALAFDYRGWGESAARVVVRDELPAERTETTARVQVIRQVVDPFDWAWDVRHALDFLEGEPAVDRERLGLWGTSYAGGLVAWVAAHDERVKCVVSQVGVQDSRTLDNPETAEAARQAGIDEVRGEVDPIPQGAGDAPRLSGTPHRSKMRHWAPVEYAERLSVPLLLIDAEHEDLFDRHRNSELLFTRMQAAGNAPVEYHVVEGARHGQIYFDRWQESSDLAVAWFDEHLKGAASDS